MYTIYCKCKIFLMAVYMIFKYGKPFRFAPLNKAKKVFLLGNYKGMRLFSQFLNSFFYHFVFQLKRVKKRRKKNQKTKKKSQKIKKKKTKIKRKKKRKRQRIRKKLRKRKRVNKKKKKKNPKIKRKKKIKKKKRKLLKKIRNRVSLTTSNPLEVMSNCHPF